MSKTNPSKKAQLFELRQLVAPGVTIANPDAHGWCALLRQGKYHEGRINLSFFQIEMEYTEYVEEEVADNEDLWEVMDVLGLDGMDWEERGWVLPDGVDVWVTDEGEHIVSVAFSRSADDFSTLLEEFKWVFGLIKSPYHHTDPRFTGLYVTTRSALMLEEAGYTEGEISRMTDLEERLAIEHHYGPEALKPKRAESTPIHTIRMFSDDLLERVTNLGWSKEEIERMDSQDVLRVDKARLGPAGLELDDKGLVVPAKDTNVTPIHWPGWLQARGREP